MSASELSAKELIDELPPYLQRLIAIYLTKMMLKNMKAIINERKLRPRLENRGKHEQAKARVG
jgi:hypothetical protein